MTHDNSDYEKIRTKLHEMLPEPYQSDVNRVVFENLFNRFLTKDETVPVAGYIGKGNPFAITKRQIREPTVHRQGFQLQPILRAKVGTIEWMNSWKDLQNEAERLGIDMDRWPEWGRVVQFNWAPPVDIDKIVHFQDYFWYDVENPASRPQYITIRSRCATATALANFHQGLVDEFGALIPIFNILPIDDPLPSFAVLEVSSTLDRVRVTGDVTGDLNAGDWFGLNGTVSNNGQFQAFGAPTFDEGNNRSTIPVAPGTFTVSESNIGVLRIQKFDKFLIQGEFIRLLEPGFVFFFKNSTNENLNQSFFEVVESSYDELENETTVRINTVFTDRRNDGDISLEEQLDFFLAERDCQCTGSIGWDLLQWDDNPDDPLWGGTPPGDHATFLAAISDPLSPFDPPNNGAGTETQLWYDTTADILYQFSEANGWKQIFGNFSTILARTEGLAFWDFTPGCGVQSVVEGADQWINANKWLHKSDVPNFSIAKQAQIPIVEYDWDLELNEWSFVDYIWQYRDSQFVDWEDTTAKPELIELLPFTLWEFDGGTGEIVLDERYGDQTDWFTPGTTFAFTTVSGIFEVDFARYVSPAPDQPWQTRITATEDVIAVGALPGDITTVRPSTTPVQPVKTSQGDGWKGYNSHWRFVETIDAVPEPHQSTTPFIEVEQGTVPIVHPSGDFEYTLNYQVQNMSVLVDILDTFELVDTLLPATSRNLRQRSLFGFDDIRVYVDEVRQFGTYDELEEVVMNITDINSATLEITVDGDVTGQIVPTDIIHIQENSGFGTSEFVVTGVVGNVITVTDPLTTLPSSTNDGVLWNVTSPIEGVDGGTSYVRGVQFLTGFIPTKFNQVRIEVGEISHQDFGLYAQLVRTLEGNSDFSMNGPVLTSLVRHRKVEQVKTMINQYPLFDIYNLDGTPAFIANHIFGYQTSQDADVNALVGLRIVQIDDDEFGMEQLLITEDESTMYAYRDYSNLDNEIWVNDLTDEVKLWDGFTWNDKAEFGDHYIGAVVSAIPPEPPFENIEGLLWYDTLNQILNERDTTLNIWIPVTERDFRDNDATLQTVWKAGLNKEEYIPAKRDWDMRTLEEYTEQRELFVEERAEEICAADLTLVFVDCEAQADTEWLADQRDSSLGHSETGEWVGDWEIPDPLYFNHMHENWRVVTTRELLTHFTSIISEQPKIPAFQGPPESMFHLISTEDVNYGLGGTIKEYNDGYDTFFSSLFINNVTPRTLFEFAHDQYESLLNGLKELYRREAVDLLTVTTSEAITDLDTFVADAVITIHEQNDFAATVYGDSTTFTEVLGTDEDLGVRNWIATLVYFSILNKVLPERHIDAPRDINEVVHHDGHRNSYFLDPAVIEFTIQTIVNEPDPRTIVVEGLPAEDTYGRLTTALPPNNIVEFEAEFNTDIINREGVYWYTVNGPDRVLRRLNIASAGVETPSSSLEDGTLWMDMDVGLEVLRQKFTNPNSGVVEWRVVEGLAIGDGRLHNGTDPSDVTTALISAWEVINLDNILSSIIFEVENRLYQNAPCPRELVYDFSQLQSTNELQALHTEYLEEAFLDFANQSEIVDPFANDDFDITDPFTWNYKFSTPGTGIEILDADDVLNAFVVAGDQRASFDSCQTTLVCPSQFSFFIKNSTVNDGSWMTIESTGPGNFSATYDGLSDTTTIFVEEDVDDGNEGIIYSGTLPSSANDGGESGGDWRDYYQKLYGTPYPHLEPWKLQGFDDKPSWWDGAYENDDIKKWGARRWKYKHGWTIADVSDTDDTFFVDGEWIELFITNFLFSIDRSVSIHNGSYNVTSYLPIIGATTGVAGSATITVDGNKTLDFFPGLRFAVTDGSGNLEGVFTVLASAFTGPPDNDTIILVEEAVDDVTGFTEISGSTYDPDTNLTKIRVVEDITDPTVEGRITFAFGMWENIRIGVIPPGVEYPNGIIGVTGIPTTDRAVHDLPVDDFPTYNYFSVNIDNIPLSNDGGMTFFDPDGVFPPFFDTTGVPSLVPTAPFDRAIRSVFVNFNIEIVAPGASFSFNDRGTIEWEWFASSQFLYDQLTVAFRMDPLRLTNQTFGFIFDEVGCLQTDERTQNTPCHCRTDFHGEVDGTQPLQFNGTNQWYVNFNRFSGFDASYSDFRTLWVNWTAPLTYQFSSYIDTPTLQVAHRFVNITEFDYSITSKISRGVEDFWLDAFQVALLNIPPALARFDNQADWVLGMTTNAPLGRVLEYYDVLNFQFDVDTTTSVCTLFKWDISDLSKFNATFTVPGNQTHVFTFGTDFDVVDSTGNDGTYSVITSVYNATDNETIIEVDEVTLSDITIDGSIIADFRKLPWVTGTQVWMSTTETLPTPLLGDTVRGTTPYFIEVLTDTTFRLARTKAQAENGQFIDITSDGRGDQFVGQINSTFLALNGERTDTIWRHYTIDETRLLTAVPPFTIQGMQNWVNFIDGYSTRAVENGWRFNSDGTLKDPDSGVQVGWQIEQERLINFAYGLRAKRRKPPTNRWSVSASVVDDEWTFISSNTIFLTGAEINVFGSSLLPTPFVSGLKYYMIRDSATTFRLAATRRDAEMGNAISITSIAAVDTLFIAEARAPRTAAIHRVNPFRNAVWFRPERGIVSNMLTGPSDDIRESQLLFDQYGRPLTRKNIRLYREDRETKFDIADEIPNDVEPTILVDPYNFLHLGGAHLFLDTYEHALVWNNRTSQDQLIYEPFIGLNVTKFEMQFNRHPEFTQRPNVGGHYLETFFNQGAELKRNIEASVDDMRNLYDVYRVIESVDLVEQGRKGLGYEGTREYLDNLNLNAKSQFIFWRGMIQAKGAVKSIQAFVNSRRFIDAQLDDFWAYKIAEFGSNGEREYVSMFVNTVDARSNEARFEFARDADFCDPGYDVNVYDDLDCGYSFPDSGDPVILVDDTFTLVTLGDQERWYEQPDQLETLRNNGSVLFWSLKPRGVIPITNVGTDTALPMNPNDGDGRIWFDGGTLYTFERWDIVLDAWVFHGSWNDGETPYLRHNFEADSLTITLNFRNIPVTESLDPEQFLVAPSVDQPDITITGVTGTEIDETSNGGNGVRPYIPFTGSVRVFKNGIELISPRDYIETLDDPLVLTTSSVLFRIPLVPADEILIKYVNSELNVDTHYTEINSNVVGFDFAALVQDPTITNLKIWGNIVDKEALNPAKVIDIISDTAISSAPIWDPARDFHFTTALNIVDLENSKDPAIYNQTLTTDQTPDPGIGFVKVYNDPWQQEQVGQVWMDTIDQAYIPYYDTKVFPDLEDRARLWGQLTDWADVRLLEWVESDIAPEEWDAVAASEEGDANIQEDQRKAGRVVTTTFETVGPDTIPLVAKFQEFDVRIDADSFASGIAILEVTDIPTRGGTATAVDFGTEPLDHSVTFDGYFEQRLFEGMSVLIAGNLYTVNSVSADGAALTTTIDVAGGNPESTDITTIADVDGSLGGKYFNIDAPTDVYPVTTPHYVWYNVTPREEALTLDFTGVDGISLPLGGDILTIGQTEVDYDGAGNNGTFVSGDGFVDLIASQTETDYDGAGSNGTFVPGNGTVDLIAPQAETDYDGVGSNGTFAAGTLYTALDALTMSNGATVTVVTVGGGGDVTTFTVDTTGASFAGGTLTSAGGTGTGFTLTPDANNVINGYEVGDILTMSNGATVTVTAIGSNGNVVSFTISTVGASFDGTPLTSAPSGDGGTGFALTTGPANVTGDYEVGDTITLSDDSVITVDAVGIDGDVTSFTVTTAGLNLAAFPSLYITLGVPLTQVSTSGTGNAFTLTPESNNGAVFTPPAAWFDVTSTTATHRFWFSDGLTVAPAVTTEILVTVPFTGAETDQDISNLVVTALVVTSGDADFAGADNSGGTSPLIDLTLATVGSVTDVIDGAVTTGAVFTVTIQGISASVDPAPVDRQPVQVDIDGDTIAVDVAIATEAALQSLGLTTWTVSILGDTVTVITNSSIDVPDTQDVDTGFGFVVVDGLGPLVGDDVSFYGLLDIYVNGRIRIEGDTSIDIITSLISVPDLTEVDRIRIIEPLLIGEARQAEVDFGVLQEAIQHTTRSTFDEFGIEQTLYYFWVDNKGTRNEEQNISPINAEQSLVTIPTPYMFQQKLKGREIVPVSGTTEAVDREETETAVASVATYPLGLNINAGSSMRVLLNGTAVPDTDFTFTEGEAEVTLQGATFAALITGDILRFEYTGAFVEVVELPQRFVQAIVRGLRGIVNDDRRYVLRFVRNFTLRDDLDFGTTPLQLKDLHEEWTLIREQQTFNINRVLWDRATEAIAGFKLDDPTTRVPALDRELYDESFEADTQFGLGNGQAFGDGELLLEIVLVDLNNPDNNFFPVDINVFFQRHSFDTPEAIIESMDTIYNTFAFEHVNRIFFSMLRDGAFPVKSKYREIFKTSMIALTGIRPFQVQGVFDD